MHLRSNGKPAIDFFRDSEFADFRATLDSEMKQLQAAGLGSKCKQAEPLSREEVEMLWEKGQLGDSSPQSLVDTMLFMNGLFFALRSGNEHHQLWFDPPQIQLVEKPGERSHLKYTEDVSKKRPGGLKGRKVKPKVVVHHASLDNPARCFVRLYKLYVSRCPPNRPSNAFYLQPLHHPTSTVQDPLATASLMEQSVECVSKQESLGTRPIIHFELQTQPGFIKLVSTNNLSWKEQGIGV